MAQSYVQPNFAKSPTTLCALRLAAVLATSSLLLVHLGCSPQRATQNLGQASKQSAISQSGSWRTIPVPQVENRIVSVAVWTDTEAIFWAGTDSSRNHVFVDAHAYHIDTASWRSVSTPGWGHPGLTGVYLNGYLYLLAKGHIYEHNLDKGSGRSLPEVDRIRATNIIVGDGNIWVIGPVNDSNFVQHGLGIAQFDFNKRKWKYGGVYSFNDQHSSKESNVIEPRIQARWSPMGVIVWDNIRHEGLVYDLDTASWKSIANAIVSNNNHSTQQVLLTEMGFALVSKFEEESSSTRIALLSSEGWSLISFKLPLEYHDSMYGATLIAAGNHLFALSKRMFPISLNLRDGTWIMYESEGFAYAETVNTVWTGEHLVLWAFEEGVDLPSNTTNSMGAILTPTVG